MANTIEMHIVTQYNKNNIPIWKDFLRFAEKKTHIDTNTVWFIQYFSYMYVYFLSPCIS